MPAEMIDLAFKPVINPEPTHLSKAQIDAFNRLGFVAPIDVFDAQQARANVAYFDTRQRTESAACFHA